MRSPSAFRTGKPGFYPDQSIYAEFACAVFKLSFQDLGGGTGLAFSVASQNKRLYFGAGRCSYYPQNSATASTLASDKHFTNQILADAGVAALGGDYFFDTKLNRSVSVSTAAITEALNKVYDDKALVAELMTP